MLFRSDRSRRGGRGRGREDRDGAPVNGERSDAEHAGAATSAESEFAPAPMHANHTPAETELPAATTASHADNQATGLMAAAAVVGTASVAAASTTASSATPTAGEAHPHAAENAPAAELKSPEAHPTASASMPVAAIAAAPAPLPTPAAAPEQIVMRKPVEQLLAERQTMLDGAGLALVETDAQKWRAAYDRASTYVEPAHTPRVRRAPPPMDHGPLQQVETRK